MTHYQIQFERCGLGGVSHWIDYYQDTCDYAAGHHQISPFQDFLNDWLTFQLGSVCVSSRGSKTVFPFTSLKNAQTKAFNTFKVPAQPRQHCSLPMWLTCGHRQEVLAAAVAVADTVCPPCAKLWSHLIVSDCPMRARLCRLFVTRKSRLCMFITSDKEVN